MDGFGYMDKSFVDGSSRITVEHGYSQFARDLKMEFECSVFSDDVATANPDFLSKFPNISRLIRI